MIHQSDTQAPLRLRRLLRQDMDEAVALYAELSRDGAWADGVTLCALLRCGALWGGFCGGTMVICGGLCPSDAPVAVAQAARATGLISARAMLLLPAAGSAAQMQLFTEALLKNAACRDAQPVALVPVKTGAEFAAGCFAAGLVLCGVRPLVSLRPHYLFAARIGVQTDAKNSTMIALQDTYALSRLLEQGFCGVALRDNEVRMEKLKA
ncbi:MAG: hypothetical protein RR825_03895 [Ruthenibacterium sp.]